jgi:Xaa-Pro aminopeptidase
MEANFLLEDMQWTAYETIVGSGIRATVLHARASNRVIQNGDLILIDAGGEWGGYCADITRTFPAFGPFSADQRLIYEIVFSAQKHVLESIKPGVSLKELHLAGADKLIEGLSRAGHRESEVRRALAKLMPHSTSHWIGMDVHDPSPYVGDDGSALRLSPGMTFTVEPGLYFREENLFPAYYGIGVRIEDDIVVTERGFELLSCAPKEIEEIELLRASL